MQYFKPILSSLLITFSLLSQNAYSKSYYMKFDSKESKINFHVTSTLHSVNGVVNKFKGSINIETTDDDKIEKAEGLLEVTTDSFFTDQKMRDSRMKGEILNVLKFPLIKFKVNNAKVTNNKIKEDGTINMKLIGTLTIRDVTKNVEIPIKAKLNKDMSKATVDGQYTINFKEYNVPDPSIPLIGNVDPNIPITFNLKAH